MEYLLVKVEMTANQYRYSIWVSSLLREFIICWKIKTILKM